MEDNEEQSESMAECKFCKTVKPHSAFILHNQTKSGITRRCKDCHNKMMKDYRAQNKERIKAQISSLKQKDPIRFKSYQKKYRENNKNKVKEMQDAWYKRNPSVRARKSAAYRSAKINATPAFANQFFIEEIYDLANRRTKATGIKWHVDHIVPLQSKIVCGLNWEGNLQVIPAISNLKKHNRYWPDMP